MDMTGEHLIVFHMRKNLLREKTVAKVIVFGKKDIKRL